jgi:hypothetical protein
MKKTFMNFLVAVFLLTAFFFMQVQLQGQVIRYVKTAASGLGDGSSWENASGNIQSMVNASSSSNQVWISGGTYLLNASLEMKEGVNIYGGFFGNETTLNERPKSDLDGNGTIEAWEFTHATVLDGQNAVRVLNQEDEYGIETIYDGFTITKGKSELGAGAYVNERGKIMNCIVKNNEVVVSSTTLTTYGGGGIYNRLGTVTDCFITGNISSGALRSQGGGIYNAGNIYNCVISGNTATNSQYYGAAGGGIFAFPSPTLVIRNCIIKNNTTSCNAETNDAEGGGVYGNQLVEDCIIENNNVVNTGNSNNSFGGGISMAKANRCIIRGNSATSGGGTHNTRLINCLIMNNNAKMGGGACKDDGNHPYINCTFVKNTATEIGGGIASANSFSKNWAYNCIIWDNNAPNYSQTDEKAFIEYSAIEGGFEGEGNIGLDPLFVNPAAENYRLQPSSPCIDKGNNEPELDFVFDLFIEKDLDRNSRVWNNIVDMGCYEYGSVVGIPSIAKENSDILVYPNPTTGELRITNYVLNLIQEQIKSVEMFDVYGKQVGIWQAKTDELVIDISHLQAGTYFLRINNETVKVVKH